MYFEVFKIMTNPSVNIRVICGKFIEDPSTASCSG